MVSSYGRSLSSAGRCGQWAVLAVLDIFFPVVGVGEDHEKTCFPQVLNRRCC